MKTRQPWTLVLFASLFVGCATPCTNLVNETCAKHGDGSKACLQAKELGERAGARDERACRMALDLLRERAAKP